KVAHRLIRIHRLDFVQFLLVLVRIIISHHTESLKHGLLPPSRLAPPVHRHCLQRLPLSLGGLVHVVLHLIRGNHQSQHRSFVLRLLL
ncbi:MAG: hypothetical protein VX416_15700, partial [Pseudomonadota bacterium]|nr:hypothetical protein [Pseudomonadota bacterium]